MAPRLIFGTASFGMDGTDFQDASSIETLLKTLQQAGIQRLDSGARYPPLKPGRAEELIGETKGLSSQFEIDTKVYTDTQTDGSGDLTHAAISKSVIGSLLRLQAETVNILHIHRADPATPLVEQVKAFNEQIRQGHCKAWGVSNVPPNMLEEMLRICEENDLQKPSCYQGDYSLITRGMESKLLPLLRAHSIAFNAFRPLASGFLTGKFVNNQHEDTRFGKENPLGKAVQRLFGGEDLHAAMKKFDTEVKSRDITPIEVASRWIAHHSALGDGDGIILGASKAYQIQETVSMINRGPLSPEILEATDELWDAVKDSRNNII